MIEFGVLNLEGFSDPTLGPLFFSLFKSLLMGSFYDTMITTGSFPKTLEIRNTPGGAIWQLYHVMSAEEAGRIANGADERGFYSRILVDFRPDQETFPTWRKEVDWGTELPEEHRYPGYGEKEYHEEE